MTLHIKNALESLKFNVIKIIDIPGTSVVNFHVVDEFEERSILSFDKLSGNLLIAHGRYFIPLTPLIKKEIIKSLKNNGAKTCLSS